MNDLEPARQQEVSAYTQILAGLKFEKDLIQRLFREGMMRESMIYQEILQEGRQEGLQEGRQEGRQEGGRSLVLRQLTRKVGDLPETLRSRIELLSL